ncbi:aminotransferase class I/II-fold pyridoxal phosphate-dependent enzyme [uncultured Megasphaera sp.]|uniref:aminotransferase class I/II-fold pyridoxal phosphate-dependent enzyme n=1 Tax=uncultured Megasphaera sp. TaxID=165188 RepID=UPI00259AAC14|nr:aminotransferase class I/II-fold pyridoxal phosphate-dependent enzyme [uncultured Megasphaera sp.]
MINSVAAPQARGKSAEDKIFGANNRATALAVQLGNDRVINGTVGAILDEEGQLVMLEAVQKAYRELTPRDMVAYAPIQGYEDYLTAVAAQCFGQSRPAGYIRACATAGGSGALHHVIHNYSQWGDEIISSDWHWGAYDSMCKDNGRSLRCFSLINKEGTFDFEDFQTQVKAVFEEQENTVIIMNSPANNPTGFALTATDWDRVLAFLEELLQGAKKNIILVPDVAYLDYSGEKEECRRFFTKFGNLPERLFVIVAYTCSKGFTMYGQRMGAMICVTPNERLADEFVAINQYSSRATWSNSNSAAMKVMSHICQDPVQLRSLEKERQQYFDLIRERADIFMNEADRCDLKYLPYVSGFFITVPMDNTQAVCDYLEKQNIFLVPLRKGIRVAVCSISKNKLKGLAEKIKVAAETVGARYL